jgi:hypothetical protein
MDKIWSLFSGKSNILKFLLSPIRFTKCLGVRVPLRPPRKKALALLIRNLGARRGWVVSTTPRPLYPWERPGTYFTGGWVGPGAGLDVCEISRPHRDSIPGPACP